MTITALEVTAGESSPAVAAGDLTRTVTVERVYHRDTRSGSSWTHALGADCQVARCVGTGSFAGLRRYRPTD